MYVSPLSTPSARAKRNIDPGLDRVDMLTNNRKCNKLTAYASLTTVGDQSWYEVEDTETVWGAKLIQHDDFEG